MGKKLEDAKKKVESNADVGLEEAVNKVKELTFARFDESVDLAVKLGVDPRKSDQMVRGTVVLPHGTGKEIKVLVFAKGEKEKEALDAGADYAGAEDMVEKIRKGWLEFDKAVATPDVMGLVGRIGKVLGPRGLMPNPKLGTVTFDVAKAVKELKAGKIEFKVDKTGIVHLPLGRASFGADKLIGNIAAAMDAITKAKPAASKGKYVRKVAISSTMGPGIRVNIDTV